MADAIGTIGLVAGELMDEQLLAEHLPKSPKDERVDLIGPEALFNGLTKRVLETMLEVETIEHLGSDKRV